MITDGIGQVKYYYQLIIKITISENRRIISKLWKRGKICIKRLSKDWNQGGGWLIWARTLIEMVYLNNNFECDWLIELSDNKLPDKNLVSELVEKSIV